MKGRYRFENLSKELPSIFARDHVEGLLGGVISAKRLANLDSHGQGPKRIRIGREMAYELVYHAQPSQYESTLKRGIISYHSRDGPLARYSTRRDRIITTGCMK
jgi:hypothetical protein